MSSIYKKGRDGYYYYQTYIKNTKTGKKDKKVFHSLKTKELSEAKDKKTELDKLYKENDRKSYFFKSLSKSFLKYNFFFSVPISVLLTLVAMDKYYENKHTQMPISQIELNKLTLPAMSNGNELSLSERLDSSESMYQFKINNVTKTNLESLVDKKVELEESLEKATKVIVPKYDIHRIDNVSEIFDQARIYATTDSSISDESKLAICRQIKLDYKKYSNILICIYVDNNPGKDLAKGKIKNISSNRIKNLWLALYSYNESEGEYFDNNPANYLNN